MPLKENQPAFEAAQPPMRPMRWRGRGGDHHPDVRAAA